MEFEKLDLHSLSETVQSRKVKTSVANLCLFLNTLDTIYFVILCEGVEQLNGATTRR